MKIIVVNVIANAAVHLDTRWSPHCHTEKRAVNNDLNSHRVNPSRVPLKSRIETAHAAILGKFTAFTWARRSILFAVDSLWIIPAWASVWGKNKVKS